MERELVEQARAGDRAAFDALVRLKVDAVYGTALAILGNRSDAQDAVQEAFLAAWRSLASLRDLDRFEAWFGRIVVNACRMSLRRRHGVHEIAAASLGGNEAGARASAEPASADRPLADAAADADAFDRAFERLTADERALLVLHHRDELPVAEIADRLGIPAGTVKSRLFAARRSLERALAREDR